MALSFYLWSRTAASNATADPAINFAEGQAPSSVNDSCRALMASTAGFRDDISGAIVTAGSATAYTVTSYQIFDTLAHLNGAMVAFTPHATNTGSTGCTLNVDGLGAKAIRSAPNVDLPSGSLILGTPYVVTYNNSDACWYLQGGAANAYSAPLGGGMIYFGATAPNSAFVFPYGQAISQTTYATLYALFGANKYGTDSGGLFTLPDMRGRVPAGADNMGGSAASRLTSASSMGTGLLGQVGGSETITMAQANMPNVTLAVTGTVVVASTPTNVVTGTKNDAALQGGTTHFDVLASGTGGTSAISSSSANSGGSISLTAASINGNTTQTVMNNVQPTIVCNYIMRVI